MIFTKETKLIDDFGRERIFHGMNMVYKGHMDEKTNLMEYKANWDDSDFDWLQANGFNLVRLGIIWAAIEPECNKIDEQYLQWVESVVDSLAKRDIFVYLDMHQDLYGEKFGDGAPKWATLDDGCEHYDNGIWSDAYLLSDAVKHSFDNFWANKELANGEGIQDHFASLWGKVVTRFAKYDNIIGYDLLNEPFNGSSGLELFLGLLYSYASITGKELSPGELIGLFQDDEQKMQMLLEVDNYDLYQQMTEQVGPMLADFDSVTLTEFYKKVTKAIRKVTDKGLILTENSYFSNMGIQAQIKSVDDQYQVYAPHGYDLVVDSPAVGLSSNNRIKVIFDRHLNVQNELKCPVIIGEWGAHYAHSEALGHIDYIQNLFDENKWSNTYWDYNRNISEYPVVKHLIRPYPMAVAGDIDCFSYDSEQKLFKMTWNSNEGAGKQQTEIFIPGAVDSIQATDKCLIERIKTNSHEMVYITSEHEGTNEVIITIK
ncbi:cellulase family glycosylhydrolase [Mollicutes bacterium LVI A0039]|nr:cellulase family glycosylhydrolase [Mollicutes bacterium LVI A0039]